MIGSLLQRDGNIVVFHIWKSLRYKTRILLSLVLIVAGLFTQLIMFDLLPGIILVFLGNVLVLPKGYNNKVDFGGFKPDASWEEVDPEKLDEVITLNKKMRKWDISAFELSNVLGAFVFILIVSTLIFLVVLNQDYGYISLDILAANIAVLLIPQWLSGIRRITTTPKLITKIKLIRDIAEHALSGSSDIKPQFHMLLTGKEGKIPSDIKFSIKFNDQPKEFLGLYGQATVNEVQGKSYPYFYVVAVTDNSHDLKDLFNRFNTRHYQEYEKQNEIQIFIIRQYTTKNSGFHTTPATCHELMQDGIRLSREILKVMDQS